MKVSQIIAVVDITDRYRKRIKAIKNELRWELTSCGETERAQWLRQEIKENEESLGKFLNEEV